MGDKALCHGDLIVYNRAFEASMALFELSKTFPKQERYSLIDQVRRSSRSVCANIAEAWWKRRYEAPFISKLTDAQAEAAETQVWIEYAVKCGYLEAEQTRALYSTYSDILGTLVGMINHSDTWILPPKPK